MTGSEQKILDAFLVDTDCELSGAELLKRTRLSSGSLYPALLDLEEAGWVSSRWKEVLPQALPRRRLYRLTRRGMRGALHVIQGLPA